MLSPFNFRLLNFLFFYLKFFCPRSSRTGYFSSFRSQLKYHLHKEVFSYHPIQRICPPFLTPFSLIFILFNCLLNIYHPLTLLALKIIISILPIAYKPLTSRDFCLFYYTMSLAIGIVTAQSWSSINICWMNILILNTQPKCHILCESPVISPCPYQNTLSSRKQDPCLICVYIFSSQHSILCSVVFYPWYF